MLRLLPSQLMLDSSINSQRHISSPVGDPVDSRRLWSVWHLFLDLPVNNHPRPPAVSPTKCSARPPRSSAISLYQYSTASLQFASFLLLIPREVQPSPSATRLTSRRIQCLSVVLRQTSGGAPGQPEGICLFCRLPARLLEEVLPLPPTWLSGGLSAWPLDWYHLSIQPPGCPPEMLRMSGHLPAQFLKWFHPSVLHPGCPPDQLQPHHGPILQFFMSQAICPWEM